MGIFWKLKAKKMIQNSKIKKVKNKKAKENKGTELNFPGVQGVHCTGDC
jgi:hypothetical protein